MNCFEVIGAEVSWTGCRFSAVCDLLPSQLIKRPSKYNSHFKDDTLHLKATRRVLCNVMEEVEKEMLAASREQGGGADWCCKIVVKNIRFIQNFDIYMIASGKSGKLSEIKAASLLNLVEEETIEVFNRINLSHDDRMKYNNIIKCVRRLNNTANPGKICHMNGFYYIQENRVRKSHFNTRGLNCAGLYLYGCQGLCIKTGDVMNTRLEMRKCM
ncbi:hypothetical protein PR048_002741 [Dryococelus australis]|uniref:Uncharacterized protein n=1 Tax=Dryococelus australis TaxID=614101 RepID=A0ABQ9IL06_9NEOP|nr:hypothetical protein PR048_002741 [Dryococelus australis]